MLCVAPYCSQLHIELEEERQSKAQLQATLAKLRHVVVAQSAAAEQSSGAHNPHIAAWYRRQYAGQEFKPYPPAQVQPAVQLAE